MIKNANSLSWVKEIISAPSLSCQGPIFTLHPQRLESFQTPTNQGVLNWFTWLYPR